MGEHVAPLDLVDAARAAADLLAACGQGLLGVGKLQDGVDEADGLLLALVLLGLGRSEVVIPRSDCDPRSAIQMIVRES